ncbi:MAG: peptidoglycan-binding protein [Gammaproteobacteria bacterium]
MIDTTFVRDSNAREPSEAHEEMGLDKRSHSRPRNQTTNPATTVYGSEEPASSEGDGEVDRDAKQPIKALLGVLAIVAVVAMGGWVAGARIESPAEAAARTAPPKPSPILVPVEERVLSSTIVTRGTARFGLPQPISLAPSALKANTAGLITTLPVLNTQLKEGDVLLTASGRPVLVLQGEFPAFRDLVPGIWGKDVLQLEQGLKRLGFDSGRTDGAYDQQTSAAAAKWYTSAGYGPFGPTIEQQANIRTLEQSLGDALKMKLSAAGAAATAARAVASARAKAAHAERVAAAELAAKVADRNTGMAAPRDQTRLTVESARAKAESANKAAAAEVDAKVLERALIVLDPRQLETARTAAETKLEMARAAVKTAQLEGELAVRAAERDATMAPRQFELAEAAVRAAQLEGEVAVRAALDAQKVAQFDAKLTAERADRLAADLDVARRKLGVQVPIDEIVFLPSLPVRVEQVTGVVGGAASGPVMSVTDNRITIDSSLPLDAAPLVKPGMAVAIDEQALGIKAKGVVEMVDKTPGTRGVDGYHIYFAVRVGESSTPLQGFSLRLTIPIESTKGAVTAVPLSALSLAADGRSRIQVENNGALEYLVVEPGMAADGFVEVTPVDGALKPGQLVVVGMENNENRDIQP